MVSYWSRLDYERVVIGALLYENIVNVTIEKDEDGDDEIHFITPDCKYIMYHEQDCCENVYIKDIDNDLQKLVGARVVMAEESGSSGEEEYGTFTWTFYKIASSRGDYFTISWYGSSNGYYSESVSVIRVPNG